MTAFSEAWSTLFVDWSVRWSVMIALLFGAFRLGVPKQVASRLWLAQLVLLCGLLLPFTPKWLALRWRAPDLAQLTTADGTESRLESSPVKSNPQSADIESQASSSGVNEPLAARQIVADSPSQNQPPRAVHSLNSVASVATSNASWSSVTFAVWAASTVLFLVRIWIGLRLLRKVREGAIALPEALAQEFEQVRREIGVTRAINIRMSSAMGGPAVIGGYRPIVLVPANWADLSVADRRAALLHELTHIVHMDDWVGYGEEVVRAAFFFHPLVHWLLNRLAREREQRCDAIVLHRGVTPLQLAQLLLEGAKRLGPGQFVLAPAAIPMFHFSSIKQRIHQLVEGDPQRWSRPISRGRACWLTIAIACFCVALGGAHFVVKAGEPTPTAEPGTKDHLTSSKFTGLVVTEDNQPVTGALVIAAGDAGNGERMTTTSDERGKFSFEKLPTDRSAFPSILFFAAKDGFAPGSHYLQVPGPQTVTLKLFPAISMSGAVKNPDGEPIPDATVQIGFVHRAGNGMSWGYQPSTASRGTSIEKYFFAKTDAKGEFRFESVAVDSEVIFRASAQGFAELDTGAGGPREGVVASKEGSKPVSLVLQPEAVINGQITSQVAAILPSTAEISIEGYETLHGFHQKVRPDAEGHFRASGLPAGPVGVVVTVPSDAPGTCAGVKVTTLAGASQNVSVEIISGVEVKGRVVQRGTDEPVPGVFMADEGLINPKGFHFGVKPTNSDGQFSLRLPPGKVTFRVWSCPPGQERGDGPRTFEVPANVTTFTIAEPFETVKVAKEIIARAVDIAGQPIANGKVFALCRAQMCGSRATASMPTNADGQFTLKYSPNGPLEIGRFVPLQIETAEHHRYEANLQIAKDGVSLVSIPTILGQPGLDDVQPGELAGIVVDETGRPLPKVKVHVWDWVDRPENFAFTDDQGRFRIKEGNKSRNVEVRFRKDGYSPVLVLEQQLGVNGLVIAMNRATYFEGVVTGPDGQPAPNAQIRVDQGPKFLEGCVYSHVWSEAQADAAGHYRLYVQPDEYAFEVKAPGVGTARLNKTGIGAGQSRKYDIRLQKGVTFRAKVRDSISGKPVRGVRIFQWEHKEVDSTSNDAGEVVINDLVPGDFEFNVESKEHGRWWSEEAKQEWERKYVDPHRNGWQRNFDYLTFALKLDMAPVTIHVEPAVRISGVVLDPKGKPVAGATVAPALTGTANSLTGDTRFSVETQQDGTFKMSLPASGTCEYNLVAHDGKYNEWRTWANGHLPPIRTTPGQVIEGVTLKLNEGAIVRGKVVDKQGRPVIGREVRAQAADKLENRYYDPTTTTKSDGTFELKFIRPTSQWIQVAPFWLIGSDAPPESSRTLTLKEGEVVNVIFTAPEVRQD
ncbi:MAG: carboxypeptidase regulatory-like domain-containing protein [Gemmataceae bacterium]